MAALLMVFAPAPIASAENITLTIRGFGTAVVDGDLAPGEWDQAGFYNFQARRAPA